MNSRLIAVWWALCGRPVMYGMAVRVNGRWVEIETDPRFIAKESRILDCHLDGAIKLYGMPTAEITDNYSGPVGVRNG